MKLCKKITGGIAKAAEVICMVMIAALVLVIVTELCRRNFFNQRGDQVSPLDNDNYFFNVSPTMGERVTCSLLRGAGEVFGTGTKIRDSQSSCLPFTTDALSPAGADVQ